MQGGNTRKNRINKTVLLLQGLLVAELVVLGFDWGGWAGEALFPFAFALFLPIVATGLCCRMGRCST
jgi:hypothetical protein